MTTCRLLTLVLLLASACKKETELDALPKATREGKHTFGCLVDGKAFLPKPAQATSITNRQPLEAYVYQGYLYISARGDGGVDIVVKEAFKPGKYFLNSTSSGSNGYYKDATGQYFTNDVQIGEVDLTRIDTLQKIAAGTFRFSAAGISTTAGKTVTITDGRFDVRLK
ncbi:DUF6252 family protein [Hymenobacter algoricola]|uniref:Lipoprotein n=1 Tax=Hymenobacter algoricola TaxID=486267 RepID=A0ABP7MI41_9BACT